MFSFIYKASQRFKQCYLHLRIKNGQWTMWHGRKIMSLKLGFYDRFWDTHKSLPSLYAYTFAMWLCLFSFQEGEKCHPLCLAIGCVIRKCNVES